MTRNATYAVDKNVPGIGFHLLGQNDGGFVEAQFRHAVGRLDETGLPVVSLLCMTKWHDLIWSSRRFSPTKNITCKGLPHKRRHNPIQFLQSHRAPKTVREFLTYALECPHKIASAHVHQSGRQSIRESQSQTSLATTLSQLPLGGETPCTCLRCLCSSPAWWPLPDHRK